MVEILYAYDKVTWLDDDEQKTHTIRDDVEEITTISQVVSIDFHEVEAHGTHVGVNNTTTRVYEITMAYVDGGSDSVFILMKKIVKNNVAETESFGLYNLGKEIILPMTAIPIINKNSIVTYNCFFPSTGDPFGPINIHLEAKRIPSVEGEREADIPLSTGSPTPLLLRVSDTNTVTVAGNILVQDIIFGFST